MDNDDTMYTNYKSRYMQVAFGFGTTMFWNKCTSIWIKESILVWKNKKKIKIITLEDMFLKQYYNA